MDKSTLYNIVLSIPLGLMFLVVITGVAKLRSLGTAQKRIVLVVGLALMTEIISRVLIEMAIKNYGAIHIYAVLEYAIIATILAIHLNVPGKRVVRVSIILMGVFALVNLLFFQGVQELNTNVITTSSVILVLLSVFIFFRILSKMVYARIEKSSFFWINIGVLIYFSSSLVLFVFGDWLTHVDFEYSVNVWMIHIFFNVIQYLCFNIALWMDPE